MKTETELIHRITKKKKEKKGTYRSAIPLAWIFWIKTPLIPNNRCFLPIILNPNESLDVCLFRTTFRTILSFAKRLLFLISTTTNQSIVTISRSTVKFLLWLVIFLFKYFKWPSISKSNRQFLIVGFPLSSSIFNCWNESCKLYNVRNNGLSTICFSDSISGCWQLLYWHKRSLKRFNMVLASIEKDNQV